MTTQNIPDLVARLHQEQAAVGAARKTLIEKTTQTQAGLHDREQKLASCVTAFTSGPREIEDLQRLIAKLEEQRSTVLAKRAVLEREVADAPDWRSIEDGRERDKEYDRQQTLKKQLELLQAGALLFAPNQVYQRVEELDAQIEKANERIEQLRAKLASHIQQAEALLAETVTG
jgi:hypothetical protein